MAVTPLIFDGFEHGIADFTGGYYLPTGNISNQTTTKRTGNRAMRLNPSDATAGFGYQFTGVSIVSAALYFRYATLPTSLNAGLLTFRGSLDYSVDFNVTSGKLNIGTPTTNADFGPTISANTWYRLVVEVDSSAATVVCRATVDNGTEGTASPVNFLADTQEEFYVGNIGTNRSYDLFVDDLVLSVTNGD